MHKRRNRSSKKSHFTHSKNRKNYYHPSKNSHKKKTYNTHYKETTPPKKENEKEKEKKFEKQDEKETDSFYENEYSGLVYNPNVSNNYEYHLSKKQDYMTKNYRTKWKTEICHYWEMYGQCKYGENCAFAHGESELKERKLTFNYKTKLCKQFFESGYCPYGSRCQFSHKNTISENCENSEKNVSYLKILSEFLSENEKISHELIKRPRLMTFENIFSCSLEESENSKLKLYEDIENLKIISKNNDIDIDFDKDFKEFKMSENTNYSNNNDSINNNESNKRERFMSA